VKTKSTSFDVLNVSKVLKCRPIIRNVRGDRQIEVFR